MNGNASTQEPEASVVTLTPEWAAALLDRAGINRSQKETKIEQYARDMQAGKWLLNGEAITVDKHGQLIDGQNRCAAVIKSGVSIRTLLVTGVEPEAIHTIDKGTPRSLSDDLQILSSRTMRYTTTVAAMVRHMHRYSASGSIKGSMQGGTDLTTAEALTLLETLPGIENSAVMGAAINHKFKIPSALAGTLHYVLYCIDPNDATFFFEQLMSGVGLMDDDPIWQLRERLLHPVTVRGRKLDQQETAALFIKAWNLYRKGEKRSQLVWRPGGANAEGSQLQSS